MRNRFLVASVQRLLDDGERVQRAAYVTHRSNWLVAFGRAFVVAQTDRRLVWCRGNRIRQVATAIEYDLAPDALEPAGSNLVASTWSIGGIRYFASRAHNVALLEIQATATP